MQEKFQTDSICQLESSGTQESVMLLGIYEAIVLFKTDAYILSLKYTNTLRSF